MHTRDSSLSAPSPRSPGPGDTCQDLGALWMVTTARRMGHSASCSAQPQMLVMLEIHPLSVLLNKGREN